MRKNKNAIDLWASKQVAVSSCSHKIQAGFRLFVHQKPIRKNMTFSKIAQISYKIMVFVFWWQFFWNLKFDNYLLKQGNIISSFYHELIVFFKFLAFMKFEHYGSMLAKNSFASSVPFSPLAICSRTSSAAARVSAFGWGNETSNGRPLCKSDCLKNIFTASEMFIPSASKSRVHFSFVSDSVLICTVAVLIIQKYAIVMILSSNFKESFYA